MSNNRVCKVCGEKYHYCFNQTCSAKQPSYMALFHDENCKIIFETLNKLYFGQITEKKAVKTLKKCDLSVLDLESADKKIKEKVDDLLKSSDPVPTVIFPEVIEEPVVLNQVFEVTEVTE